MHKKFAILVILPKTAEFFTPSTFFKQDFQMTWSSVAVVNKPEIVAAVSSLVKL